MFVVTALTVLPSRLLSILLQWFSDHRKKDSFWKGLLLGCMHFLYVPQRSVPSGRSWASHLCCLTAVRFEGGQGNTVSSAMVFNLGRILESPWKFLKKRMMRFEPHLQKLLLTNNVYEKLYHMLTMCLLEWWRGWFACALGAFHHW